MLIDKFDGCNVPALVEFTDTGVGDRVVFVVCCCVVVGFNLDRDAVAEVLSADLSLEVLVHVDVEDVFLVVDVVDGIFVVVDRGVEFILVAVDVGGLTAVKGGVLVVIANGGFDAVEGGALVVVVVEDNFTAVAMDFVVDTAVIVDGVGAVGDEPTVLAMDDIDSVELDADEFERDLRMTRISAIEPLFDREEMFELLRRTRGELMAECNLDESLLSSAVMEAPSSTSASFNMNC